MSINYFTVTEHHSKLRKRHLTPNENCNETTFNTPAPKCMYFTQGALARKDFPPACSYTPHGGPFRVIQQVSQESLTNTFHVLQTRQVYTWNIRSSLVRDALVEPSNAWEPECVRGQSYRRNNFQSLYIKCAARASIDVSFATSIAECLSLRD